LFDQRGGLSAGQRSLAQHIAEAAPGNVAHRVKGLAVDRADLVDGDGMFMVEASGGASFGLEALEPLRARLGQQVGHAVGPEQLEGGETVGAALAGPVDGPHAALSDLLQDLVFTEPLYLADRRSAIDPLPVIRALPLLRTQSRGPLVDRRLAKDLFEEQAMFR